MNKKDNVRYYLINDRILGKKEEGTEYLYYLFRDGRWIPDVNLEIMKKLVGFDPYEPEGSPYIVGNLSIMMEIEEIPFDKAIEVIRSEGKNHEHRQ